MKHPTSGYLGLLIPRDKWNHFSITFSHKSIQAFYPLLQKYISNVLHRTTLTVTAETRGLCGWSCSYQEGGWTCECRYGQLTWQICASWTLPSWNSSFAVSSRGAGEFTDKCLLLNECNIPLFSMLVSTLMFSVVGTTVTTATGEESLSPWSQSVFASCRQKELSACE